MGAYINYNVKNISELAALTCDNKNMEEAAKEIPELEKFLCANPNVNDETWEYLRKRKLSAEASYNLGFNATTSKRQESILEDKRVLPLKGLFDNKDITLNTDFLNKIYSKHPKSLTIIHELVTYPYTSVDLLEDLQMKTKSHNVYALGVSFNKNVDAAWVINYFLSSSTSGRRSLLARLQVVADTLPDFTEKIVNIVLNPANDIVNMHQFRIIEESASSRWLNFQTAENIKCYVESKKTSSRSLIRIVSELVGNPSTETAHVNWGVELLKNKTFMSKAYKGDRQIADTLVDVREKLPKKHLKQGWDYELDSDEQIVFNCLGKNFMASYSVRADVQHKYSGGTLDSDYSYTTNGGDWRTNIEQKSHEKAREVKTKAVSSHWTWLPEILASSDYINTSLQSASYEAWMQLLRLGFDWDGNLGDLINVAHKL